MAGLLTDDGSGWDIDPSLLSLMAQSATAPDPSVMASMAAAPPAPDASSVVAPAPADSGTGFWGGLANATGNVGLALGGGLDPSITGDARSMAGQRALLSFGLNMLANSGPSYTPRNFGQILATGLQGAAESNLTTEQNRVKAQQVGATLALKAGQLRIQELLAGIKGTKGAQQIGAKTAISDLAGAGGGAPAAVPAAGDTTVTPPAATPGDFVSSNAPLFQDVATRTGLPVDFVAGQAGNESGWGTSPAATAGNNLFGLSDDTGKPLTFPTVQAGVDAYVNLMNGKYAKVPRTGSADEIGAALGAAGYNTVTRDYGARVGGAAALARRLLPQPTTTGATGAVTPGTMVAGPGAGSGAPTDGTVAPAPSSTPPSPGTAVPAPVLETLPPAVLPDVAARTADIEDTYQRQLAAAKASGNDQLLAKANQDRLDNLAKLKQDVTAGTAAQQKAQIDHNAQLVENQKNRDAEAARNAATIQGQKDVEALKAAAAQKLAETTAGYTAQQRQVDTEQQTGSKQLESMGTAAQKAEAIQPMVRDLIPLLKNAPSGAFGQVLQGHPEWIPALTAAGIVKPETATISQLVNGLTDYLSLDLKPSATGALRTVELPLLKGLTPSLAQSPQAQQQALARILNYTQRVKDEYDLASQNFGTVDPTTNLPNYKILYKNLDAPMQLDANGQRTGGGLGPTVPEPPPLISPNATPEQQAASVEAARRYTKYIANLPSGMPYNTYQRQPDGSMKRVLMVQP